MSEIKAFFSVCDIIHETGTYLCFIGRDASFRGVPLVATEISLLERKNLNEPSFLNNVSAVKSIHN